MAENGERVVARFVAKPSSVEDVKRILTDMIDPTRAEDGCITYELLQNSADPTDFTFVEEWDSKADLDRHAVSEHIKMGRELVKEHLARDSDVRVYTLIR
ncbi:MAG: putative quinol monooxygenase [Pyrinomonadaceae bacterium]